MDLRPVARRALLAAFQSKGYSLSRTRGGYAGMPRQVTTSTTAQVEVFTRRAVNWLDDSGLVDFDDPDFPSQIKLNDRGIAMAQQLTAAQRAPKAGAA